MSVTSLYWSDSHRQAQITVQWNTLQSWFFFLSFLLPLAQEEMWISSCDEHSHPCSMLPKHYILKIWGNCPPELSFLGQGAALAERSGNQHCLGRARRKFHWGVQLWKEGNKQEKKSKGETVTKKRVASNPVGLSSTSHLFSYSMQRMEGGQKTHLKLSVVCKDTIKTSPGENMGRACLRWWHFPLNALTTWHTA